MQIYFISFRFLLLAHKTTPFFHCFYLNILSFYVWPGCFHFLFRLNMFFLFSLAWTFCLIILFGLDIFFHILFIGLTFSFLFFFGLNIFFHYFILGEGGGEHFGSLLFSNTIIFLFSLHNYSYCNEKCLLINFPCHYRIELNVPFSVHDNVLICSQGVVIGCVEAMPIIMC